MKTILENVGILVIAWLIVMSLVLFFAMRRDKRLASEHQQRISEATLFLLAIVGGALGGVLAMQIFHHKTKHKNFILGFPILALIQWGLTIVLMLPE